MEHQHTPEKSEGAVSPDAVAKGYEPHDIGLGVIFLFVAGLVVTMIVVLAFVYAVMMAMADHDRSTDAIASPLNVKLPAIYAPLQPSLGFNGNHDNDHDVLDMQDMELMREKTEQALNSEGTSPQGRRYISIASAIDLVVDKSLLECKPALQPVAEPVYPPGSREGVYPGMPKPEARPDVHMNDMNSLNRGDDN